MALNYICIYTVKETIWKIMRSSLYLISLWNPNCVRLRHKFCPSTQMHHLTLFMPRAGCNRILLLFSHLWIAYTARWKKKERTHQPWAHRIVQYCDVKFEESSWIITAAIRLPPSHTLTHLPMLTFFVSCECPSFFEDNICGRVPKRDSSAFAK